MATFDGDINDIADDVVKEDGVKARAALAKLEPADVENMGDDKDLKENLKKLLTTVQDPQDAEDGKRFMNALRKLLGIAPKVSLADQAAASEEMMAQEDKAMPRPIVDTSVLAGPLPDLKNFLIKKQRDNEAQ